MSPFPLTLRILSLRLFLLLLGLVGAVSARAQGADALEAKATAAYQAGEYAQGARLYAAALDAGSRSASVAYNAACSFALAGDEDAAFDYLRQSIALGWANADLLQRDSDFGTLHDDPRWPDIVAATEARAAAAERLWGGAAFQTPFREDLPAEEKLAGLSLLWSEAKYNFVNFDLVPALDWDSLYVATIPQVLATTSTEAYYRVLTGMVAQLHDGHSNVYVPSELGDRVYARPGLRTRLVGGYVVVTEIRDPALAEQGLAVGQEVVAVDGVPVREYAERNVRPYQSASTDQDLDVRTYEYMLLAGDAARPVALTLRQPDGTTLERTLPRLTGAQAQAFASGRPAFDLTWLPGRVAHVRLNTFGSDEAAEAFLSRFDEIAEAEALVLDVRENGGGNSAVGWRVLCTLTDADSIAVSSWYTRLYRPSYRAWGQSEETTGDRAPAFWCEGGRRYGGPVAVLTSARTFSAAEDFAVAFDVMDRGPLVGEPTGGSTGQPLFFPLPGGGSGRVTTKHDAYPDGHDFVGVGVLPDVPVAPTVESLRSGTDPVLDAAVRVLTSE